MRDEIRSYNTKIVEQAVANNKGLKSVRQQITRARRLMVAVRGEDGSIITDRDGIVERCAEYYRKLYSSTADRPDQTNSSDEEPIPDVLSSEVEKAVNQMKRNKAPGEDGIAIELIKEGGAETHKLLASLFTSCIRSRQTPKEWNNGIIILLHKKGDVKDIGNYRPISLISHISKLLTKVIQNRLEGTLDFNQPREQAGFRKGFSTTDHLQVVTQLIEKTNEYGLPLCLAFVDYEKAFDSVEHKKILEALGNHGVNKGYIELLTHMYNNGTSVIRLDRESSKFPIQRGVRQGDTISPKLFNAGLEQVFRELKWDNKGIEINGDLLNHLRFADDNLLICSSGEELQDMLKQLDTESSKLGLKMNMKKTKVMFNKYAPERAVTINGSVVERVEEYVYLGQLVTTDSDKTAEIKRRMAAGWGAFGKYRDIMKSKMPMCLKRKIYNQCVQAAITYGCQTWALTRRMQERLRVTQRSMERAMIGITRRDKMTNVWIRQQTGLQDIVVRSKELKWQWAGHVARLTDNRWTKQVTEWIPSNGKRKRARPKTRWEDEIRKSAGVTWMRMARNREQWKIHGEAFIQQWI
jgi:hypothetical protein